MSTSGLTSMLLPAALFLIMLGLGISLTTASFGGVLRRPAAMLLGVGGQLLLLPLLALAVVSFAGLPVEMAAGLMILSFAPGGATSNMITNLCRGNTAYSVALTTLTSLVTPFTLPLLTAVVLAHWMGEEQQVSFPVLPAIARLLLVTIVPVVVGMMLNARYPAACRRFRGAVKWLSAAFLVIVVVGLSASAWGQIRSSLSLLLPVCLCLTLVAMLAGFLLGRLGGLASPLPLTLAIEVGIQNAGTALLMTATILDNAGMTSSALVYGVVMQVPALLLIAWRNLPVAGRSAGPVA